MIEVDPSESSGASRPDTLMNAPRTWTMRSRASNVTAASGPPAPSRSKPTPQIVLPELVRRQFIPDVVTDQTSAHDALNGYVPNGLTLAEADTLRRTRPERMCSGPSRRWPAHVRALLALKRAGAVAFDYGNNIRAQAEKGGVSDAFSIPGFVPEYIRPLFCEGRGPFRWAALSGSAADIAATDALALDMFADNPSLVRWIRIAQERVAFQGLPARIFWLGYGERARFGLAINDLVRRGVVAAPIVIGRDHLDAGSVASPYRETEGMRDGSDAIADGRSSMRC